MQQSLCRRQTQSVEEAKDIIATTLMLLDVCPVDRSVLDAAIASGMVDFEDAVQVACAESQGLDVIVTRNQEDFQTLNVGVVSPEILLHRL